MKAASRIAPLYRDQDSERIRDEIKAIQATGADVIRPTDFQLKVGRCNYFPTSGRISIDGERACPQTGIEAFLELIK